LETIKDLETRASCTVLRKTTHWYDYDLVSAYTTAMAELTLPDYHKGSLIEPEKLND
jgi:hypothetical protein